MKRFYKGFTILLCVLALCALAACGKKETSSPVTVLNAAREAAGMNSLKENDKLSSIAKDVLDVYLSWSVKGEISEEEFRTHEKLSSLQLERQKILGKELSTVAFVCNPWPSNGVWNFVSAESGTNAVTATASYVGSATATARGKVYFCLVLAREKVGLSDLLNEQISNSGSSVVYDNALEKKAIHAVDLWKAAMEEMRTFNTDAEQAAYYGYDAASEMLLRLPGDADTYTAESFAMQVQSLCANHEITGLGRTVYVDQVTAYGYTSTEYHGQKYVLAVVRFTTK